MSEVTSQWGRLIYWLGQNGAAIQALAAIITGIFTAVLIGVTGWYAYLTRGLLEASNAAIRSGFMPDLVGRIDIDFPSNRRDRLLIEASNEGLPPSRIIRAKVVGGIIHQWSDPPVPPGPYNPNEFKAEAHFRDGPLPELTNRFLRHGEKAHAMFTMVPDPPMTHEDWLSFLARYSLTVRSIVEVSDISGRIVHSFDILRSAASGTTHITTHLPSIFNS